MRVLSGLIIKVHDEKIRIFCTFTNIRCLLGQDPYCMPLLLKSPFQPADDYPLLVADDRYPLTNA